MTLEVNESEYDNLLGLVSSMEAHLMTATDGTRQMLNNVLANAKGRLADLEKKMVEERKAETQVKELALDTALDRQKLIDRETALSGSEKQIYGKFLDEEFFTKKDFGRLEQFYSKSWDRLSEGGKVQMSQRIWGGIQRGEYTFGEMPEVVQKDESKQLYLELTGKIKAPLGCENIPAQDKSDFIREYEAGDKQAVAKTLSRKNFSENLDSQAAVSKDTAEQKQSGEKLNSATTAQQTSIDQNQFHQTPATAFNDDQPSVSPTALSLNNGSKTGAVR